MTTGRYLCGAVRFRVTGPLRPVVACHCTQCRRTSGHHVAATSAHRLDVILEGQPVWYHSSPSARRGFCGVCGSNLFWDGGGSHLSIFAGTLDASTGPSLGGHIFCADKGDHYRIEGELPQLSSDDPDLTG